MKKIKIDKQYMKICMYVLFVIVSAIVIEKILGNLQIITFNAKNVLDVVAKILSPFLVGTFIAYLLNSPVKSIEGLLVKNQFFKSKKSVARTISIIITYILLIGIMIFIGGYLIPEAVGSTSLIFVTLPERLLSLEISAEQFLRDSNVFEVFNTYFSNWSNLFDFVNAAVQPIIKNYSSVQTVLAKVIQSTVGLAYGILNFIIALVIAFYMLSDKDIFVNIAKKIVFTLFKKSTAEKIVFVGKNSNHVFEKFFIGKAIDSAIISVIFFIFAIIFKFPYAILLTLIIGVTNMIPYFGPFVGTIIVVLISMLSNPIQALWILLLLLILHQIDAIIIGPKVLGESTGLRPISVIFAIIVGGATFGVIGMFLGVPVFAVLSSMFTIFLNRKYDEKYTIHTQSQSQFQEGEEEH